ncbi:MAG: hypothetical protein LBB59_07755 [Campylobacteraceae bacterium]|jgi:hypothetical protein|nr:hypothetical protein [Campylobacteraceae bacterium]
MRCLFKLSLTAFAVLFLASCGGSGGSGGNGNVGSGDFSDFLSDIPPLDTAGYTKIGETKSLAYQEESSTQPARELNITISRKDFTLFYQNYISDDNFNYDYYLKNPGSKNLINAHININAYAYDDSSRAHMQLASDRSIGDGKFDEVFGKMFGSPIYAELTATYEGNMSAEFAAYYAEAMGSGKLFDISDADVYCYTYYYTYGIDYFWTCEKGTADAFYYFTLEFDVGSPETSYVRFGKQIF